MNRVAEVNAGPQLGAEARAVVSLSLGAKLSIVAGLLVLAVAAYLYWGPIGHDVSGGFPAKCGSAAKPPDDTLGLAVCGSVNDVRRAQAMTMLAAGIVVAAGGVLSFGFTRVPSQHTRPSQ